MNVNELTRVQVILRLEEMGVPVTDANIGIALDLINHGELIGIPVVAEDGTTKWHPSIKFTN